MHTEAAKNWTKIFEYLDVISHLASLRSHGYLCSSAPLQIATSKCAWITLPLASCLASFFFFLAFIRLDFLLLSNKRKIKKQ